MFAVSLSLLCLHAYDKSYYFPKITIPKIIPNSQDYKITSLFSSLKNVDSVSVYLCVCLQPKMMQAAKNMPKRTIWSAEEDSQLISVLKANDKKRVPWKRLAEKFHGRSAIDLRNRWNNARQKVANSLVSGELPPKPSGRRKSSH